MNASSAPQAPNGFGVTEIAYDLDGAEIFLDDKFVGTTPATLRIAEGPRTPDVTPTGIAPSAFLKTASSP